MIAITIAAVAEAPTAIAMSLSIYLIVFIVHLIRFDNRYCIYIIRM